MKRGMDRRELTWFDREVILNIETMEVRNWGVVYDFLSGVLEITGGKRKSSRRETRPV